MSATENSDTAERQIKIYSLEMAKQDWEIKSAKLIKYEDENLEFNYSKDKKPERKKQIVFALAIWRFIRDYLAYDDDIEDIQNINQVFGDGSLWQLRRDFFDSFDVKKNPYLRIVFSIESLPTKAWRKILWEENINFDSFESCLRRMDEKQLDALAGNYNDFVLWKKTPRVFSKIGKILRKIDYQSLHEKRLCNDKYSKEYRQRYSSKGTMSYNLLNLDFGFNAYPLGLKSDEKNIEISPLKFLSVKNHDDDFIVNQEDGKYWWLYRRVRSNFVICPKKEVKLKTHICPGFWLTLIMHLLFWVISPICAIISFEHIMEFGFNAHWSFMAMFYLPGLLTSLWLLIASVKLFFISIYELINKLKRRISKGKETKIQLFIFYLIISVICVILLTQIVDRFLINVVFVWLYKTFGFGIFGLMSVIMIDSILTKKGKNKKILFEEGVYFSLIRVGYLSSVTILILQNFQAIINTIITIAEFIWKVITFYIPDFLAFAWQKLSSIAIDLWNWALPLVISFWHWLLDLIQIAGLPLLLIISPVVIVFFLLKLLEKRQNKLEAEYNAKRKKGTKEINTYRTKQKKQYGIISTISLIAIGLWVATVIGASLYAFISIGIKMPKEMLIPLAIFACAIGIILWITRKKIYEYNPDVKFYNDLEVFMWDDDYDKALKLTKKIAPQNQWFPTLSEDKISDEFKSIIIFSNQKIILENYATKWIIKKITPKITAKSMLELKRFYDVISVNYHGESIIGNKKRQNFCFSYLMNSVDKILAGATCEELTDKFHKALDDYELKTFNNQREREAMGKAITEKLIKTFKIIGKILYVIFWIPIFTVKVIILIITKAYEYSLTIGRLIELFNKRCPFVAKSKVLR